MTIEIKEGDRTRTLAGAKFRDAWGMGCVIQGSLHAIPAIYLGPDHHEHVMTIDQGLAADLWPLLKAFAETGKLPTSTP